MRRPLHPDQARAVNPHDVVWLSASAGTGKTEVLKSRVLRLLLEPGVTPDRILCLTFTKAGATEMAARINRDLADWVRMDDTLLFQKLEDIGAPSDPEARERARSLFASVLDCPGGGLRIETIHAFSQWLLSAFPMEMDMQPGFKPMEDRDRILLLREVLAQLIADAAARADTTQQATLSMLMMRFGKRETLEGFLLACAGAPQLWSGPLALTGDLAPHINRALGLPAGGVTQADLMQMVSDEAVDTASLEECARTLAQWKTATNTGPNTADFIVRWLGLALPERLAEVSDLLDRLITKSSGKVANIRSLGPKFPDYEATALKVGEELKAVLDKQALDILSKWLAPAFTLGRDFALRFAEAKLCEGLIDYDDQIRLAADLLARRDLSDWVRYKLDRQFDHVLVDEAQDTNPSQWDIIHAITDEYFAGEGAKGSTNRTLFVVGDYKQAIYGFQGTSPENFALAHDRVRTMSQGAERPFQDVPLARSFRTAQPVLDFVDGMITTLGPQAMGLDSPPVPHQGSDRPGRVVLWNAITKAADAADTGDVHADNDNDNGDDTEEQGWLSRTDRRLAERIAGQVKIWLRDGFPLFKGQNDGAPRQAGPGDIMVLVRSRTELAGLIVARLHSAGVPVAGVDRLRLAAPLAVRDVMAALRFAAQPLDDLSLAALLVSPLFGWSQDDLLAHGYRDRAVPLWEHLRRSREAVPAAAVAALTDLLRRVDYEPPQATISWMLGGPWQGRRKLTARLGAEADDPLDELINQAGRFVASHPPSLDGFVHWFDASNDDVKREGDAARGQVRVMTVHGSKGLEAPIVILADAAYDPARKSDPKLALPLADEAQSAVFPMPSLNNAEKVDILADISAEARRRATEEHWRLLYVAMTRAEEALFIAGATNAKNGAIPEQSWYAAAERLMLASSREKQGDPLWAGRYEWGNWPADKASLTRQQGSIGEARAPEPAWLRTPIGPEPRPPRPLAPSSLGPDDVAELPQFDAELLSAAARRGVLMHRLLERLPDLADAQRHAAATRWLEREAADLSDDARAEMRDAALGVLSDPQWASLFGPGSLAEVPITATVDGMVIAGTVDRLLITPDAIRAIDYKTARRVPAGLAQLPAGYLRQMAAYARALAVIYPGRTVEAALLYTAGPALIPIPADVLEAQTLGQKAEA